MRNQKKPSIFFLGPANLTSTLHRCLMISRELESRGHESKCFSLSHIFRAPNLLSHIDCWRTIVQLHPNFLVLHRNSNLVDFAMIKRIKKSHPGIKIIFDYDDALFHVRLPGRIASYSHLNQILSISDGVTAGSHYLKEFACKLNKNVTLMPSPVDMNLFDPSTRRVGNSSTITIGWLGAGVRSQLRYLRILKDPLNALAQKYDLKLKIVSALTKAIKVEFSNQRFDVDFGLDHWVPIEQTPALISDFDIGVMPLTDDPWSRGKCAMKLLEYMSMKLPTVSSAVGENRYVIDHGRDGFLATSPEEWADCIEALIINDDLRREMGENGYSKIERTYSLPAVVNTLEGAVREIDEAVKA
jgi:glycosyltransferase involved in cell wall biosynthesis